VAPFDPWDQAVLTTLIQKPLTAAMEAEAPLGATIAPMRSIQARTAKMQIGETKAFGLGQFKAPDATPPLFKSKTSWKEQIVEMALLEEMERISGEEWLNLNSPDERIRRVAGVDLLDKGRMLQLRNERLTEWMRWQAFQGTINIPYNNSDSVLAVDFGFVSGHKPTASALWTDFTNSDPVADLTTWSELLGTDSGYPGLVAHMSSKTWQNVVKNLKVKALLTGNDRSLLIPNVGDFQALLPEGFQIKLYDGGYRAVGATGYGDSSLTRYLPHNRVLLTTPYSVGGDNIAETLDGQVLVSDSYNSVAIRQGFQSETILDHMSKTHFLRAASARIPQIKHPECFLWATVG
jgi:major capsid protein E